MNDDILLPNPGKKTPESDKPESDFKTPEEVADEEEIHEEEPKPVKKSGLLGKLKDKLTKKQIIILSVVLVLLLGGLLGYALVWKNKRPAAQQATKAPAKKEEPPKTTEPSKLTGIEVPKEYNQRQVTGVMIENSPDARPQSGLKDAGVVFEAIAEGGVTRFLALFQDVEPDYVGPIRSARPYYIEWLLGFDASYAHVGGSPDALNAIKSYKVKDLDQFANAKAYDRVSNRYAPHNVYTSIARLNELEQSKGYTTSNYTGFTRKKNTPANPPNVKSIDLRMSGFLYNPHWDYDPNTNNYLRSMGGKPHTDEKSGAQLSFKVVVALVTTKGVMADGYHTTYATTGSNKAYVFQDGIVIEGTWSKTAATGQITFKDGTGQPLKLNEGQTWVTVVGAPTDVTYKP